MSRSFQASRRLHRQAAAVMPRGVSSNVRYWGEQDTLYAARAKGAHLWDVDGNRYIDYRLAFGPVILGHADSAVDRRVIQAIQNGVSPGFTTLLEIEVAKKVVAMCPAVEKVRFVNSGTEATQHALRLARAFTGRERIVKFEGGYHGAHDQLLFSTYAPPEAYGSRRSPIPIPASSGIPSRLGELVITLPFNDVAALQRTFAQLSGDIAAVITEPVLGNFGCIEPQPGFLQILQEQCAEYGSLLLFDEVKTGFRIARGGAQEIYGIRPDLTAYAKSLGNGYPVAAFGGRSEIMDLLGEGVTQGGTYAGNACSIAAADATLGILQSQPVLEHIAQAGLRLQQGLRQVFERAGVPIQISGFPAIFGLAFSNQPFSDARSWVSSNRNAYQRFARLLLERGVLIDHDPREPWCLCAAHSAADIDETLQIVQEVIPLL